jgi:hypothetical protein
MSANLDLVRSIYADWERGDWTSAEWADPEIEFVIVDGPRVFSTTGVAGMAEKWRNWLGAWEGFRMEADEFRAKRSVLAAGIEHQLTQDLALGAEHANVAIGDQQDHAAALIRPPHREKRSPGEGGWHALIS